jgi:hypothetical protein
MQHGLLAAPAAGQHIAQMRLSAHSTQQMYPETVLISARQAHGPLLYASSKSLIAHGNFESAFLQERFSMPA